MATTTNDDAFSQTEPMDDLSTTASSTETTTGNKSTETSENENSVSIRPALMTTTGSSDNGTVKFECPEQFGLYPDPQSCFKFYHCSHWKPYHKKCPSNLHFNPKLKVCDWPYRAGCGTTASTTVTEQITSTPSTPETNATHCDCDSCELPILGDCNSYILCIDKSANFISCGSGLNFNVNTGTCDWEDNVSCEKNIQCPQPTGRFPYPRACYHFLECDNDVIAVKKCPEGMVYSKSEERCSWTASCEDTYTSTETTYSDNYNDTTNQETSKYFTKPTENGNESSTKDTRITSTNNATSDLSSLPSTRTMSTTTFVPEISTQNNTEQPSENPSHLPPLTTSKKEGISTSSFSETYEDATTQKDINTSSKNDTITDSSPSALTESVPTSKPDKTTADTSQTTISGEKEITTTFSSSTLNDSVPTSKPDKTSSGTSQTTISGEKEIPTTFSSSTLTDSVTASKPDKIITEESNITENFTVLSTSASVPSESVPSSSNPNSTSTSSTEFSTSANLFHTETDIPDSSTMSPTAESPVTEIDSNSSTSVDASSYKTASATDAKSTNSADFTDASTKKLKTTIPPSTEISISPSNGGHSVVTDPTISSNTTQDYQKTTSSVGSTVTVSSNETSTDRQTNSSFVCPSRFGLFPDPENCFRFYQCSQWVDHHKWCPSGLHFNPKLQVCDWPYRAGCGVSSISSESIHPKEEESGLSESCDCECCFYPNKTDCSKYTLCLGGVLYRGECAEGLLFDSINDNCDIAERVKCPQTSLSCPAPNGTYPHPFVCSAFYRCSNGQPFKENCPDNQHFKASEKKCVDPCNANCDRTLNCTTRHPTSSICIEDDGLYPNVEDCSSYYQCAEGHAYFVKCPDGLHFNVEYGVCEPPCDAGCDPSVVCSTPVLHAKGKSSKEISSLCPRPTGLFPVSEDCGAYYLCSNGKPHLLRCPPGLHYSVESEMCEKPCDARCEMGIDCSHLSIKSSAEKFVALSSRLSLWLQCKTISNGTLPNPKNCTSFYKCSSGKLHLEACPKGLHFDAEDQECKSPCLAACDQDIQCPTEIPVPKGKCSCEDCYLQDPTDCSAFFFCSQGSLTKGYCPRGTLFDRSSSECRDSVEVTCEAIGDPAMCRTPSGSFPHPGSCKKFVECEDSVAHIKDCEDGLEFDPTIRACTNPKGYCDVIGKDAFCKHSTGQFIHPKNSSLFYQCENGVKYLKSCPSPLIYNALDQVCDWPHNVQGKIRDRAKEQGNKANITEHGSTLPPYENFINSSAKSCHVIPGVTCPCACRVTTYDNCNSFYHCRGDGKACMKNCPEGLYFNRKTMVCDLPQNVECRDFFFATLRRLKAQSIKLLIAEHH